MFLRAIVRIAIVRSIEFRALTRPKASTPSGKFLPVDKFSDVIA
jgi:hypothetical protein